MFLNRTVPRTLPLKSLGVFLLTFGIVAMSLAQDARPGSTLETGKFRLHKFQQPIGEETYTITKNGDTLTLKDDFKFTDRGQAVPLTTTLTTDQKLTPKQFVIKGSIARGSTIDDEITINGKNAAIREEKETRTATVGDQFFTIAGYAPASMQMMLMRYLAKNKIKGELATLPNGTVNVVDRGKDVFTIEGRSVEFRRYLITGLIWGREWLWMDAQQNLVALVSDDAEFDHFEAIREGYEASLADFVSKAAADGMAALSDYARSISPQSKGAIAITNANLIDGTGAPVIADAVVVIEDGRIKAAGPKAAVAIPRGAKTFDAQGKYVLPGLWDMHAHFEQVEWGPVYLAAGVTTVRDVGNEFDFIKAVRDSIAEGRGLGPRMLLAGIVDGDSDVALGIIRANNADEAKAVVKKYHDANFQQMKIYSSIRPDVLKVICDEAHRLGMTVTGHIPRGMNAIQGVEAGMDQINHIQYLPRVLLPKDYKPQPGIVPTIDLDSAEARSAIKFFKDHQTVFDPTMVVFDWFLHPASHPFSEYEPGAAKVPKELYAAINNSGVPPEREASARATEEMYLKIIGALHRAGLEIVAGTDQVVPGHSLRHEIELYVKAGFTAMEAIQAATIVPARIMKVDKDLGTVEAGKFADLILVEGNPLDNVSNLRNTRFVVADGRIYDCAKLWASVGFKP